MHVLKTTWNKNASDRMCTTYPILTEMLLQTLTKLLRLDTYVAL